MASQAPIKVDSAKISELFTINHIWPVSCPFLKQQKTLVSYLKLSETQQLQFSLEFSGMGNQGIIKFLKIPFRSRPQTGLWFTKPNTNQISRVSIFPKLFK